MRKLLSFICALIIPFNLLPISAFAGSGTLPFTDVAKSPYLEHIQSLYDLGVIEGYFDSTFRPDNPINRAELLKIVFSAIDEGSDEYEGGCFPDVKNQWFAPYVCKAQDLLIIQGYPNGLYKPEREINMVEAFKIIIKGVNLPLEAREEGDQFWYVPYQDFIHDNNLLSKFSYFPERSITRAEVAYLVNSLIEIKSGERSLSNERSNLSEGCGVQPPGNPPTRFTVRGQTRTAVAHVPPPYSKDTPMKLVIGFHGRTSPNTEVRKYYGFERPSGGEAIFVYPAGLKVGASFTWSAPGDRPDQLRAYEFFDEIVDIYSTEYCIDMDEIYVVGHSLGAWITNSIACARGDVVRGVATLGGSRSNSDCTGPTAAMVWHNPKDRLASFASGEIARDQFVEQNQCTFRAQPVEPYEDNCIEYQGCYEHAPTVWCPHRNDYSSWDGSYYPHNWPKGTGAKMWDFLKGLPG